MIFRETSNIYDGSAFTADMAVQNCIGDAFRGATWVSIHNGGGVGWGEGCSIGSSFRGGGAKPYAFNLPYSEPLIATNCQHFVLERLRCRWGGWGRLVGWVGPVEVFGLPNA